MLTSVSIPFFSSVFSCELAHRSTNPPHVLLSKQVGKDYLESERNGSITQQDCPCAVFLIHELAVQRIVYIIDEV